MKKINQLAIVVACALYGSNSNAELLLDPAAEAGQVSLMAINGKTGYTDEDGGDVDIERTTLAVSVRTPITSDLEVFGALGLIGNAKIPNVTDGDLGFVFGGGLVTRISSDDGIGVDAYGQFLYHTEDLGSRDNDVDIEAAGFEFSTGALVKKRFDSGTEVFGGVEYLILTDGEIEASAGNATAKSDLKRENNFGIKAGASISTGGYQLTGIVSLLNESSISLGLSKSF